MTSSTMPSADADHVRTRSWAPDPLRPSGPDESTDALLRSLEKALIGTLTDRLGIAASFQSDAEDGDAFDVTSAVDGFVAPVTCRIGAQAGMWLVRQMYGADESTSSGRERELNGPIARRIVNEVLSLFVETFREAASIGSPQHATSAEASSDDMASGASETETIIVNPAAIGVEYVVSRQDMARVLSKRRAQTLRRPDRSVEALRAFEDRIETALVRLDATLDEREVSLGEIRRWQIGDLLRLKSSPTSVVDLNIDGRPLFRCELARDDGHFALRVLEERTRIEEGELMSRVQADVGPTSTVCDEANSASTERISVVDAIPLKISVVLGSAVMSVREVANLRPGALLTLDRKLGQPVDIIVNDRLVCRGQIAVTEDAPPQFVVRIVELASGSIPDRPRQ